MTEKEWLHHENAETRRLITLVFTNYDDARVGLDQAKHEIAVIVEATMSRVFNRGFTAGINAADLDDSTIEDEFEINLDEEGEEHP